jgi:chromosome segregation ATPase
MQRAEHTPTPISRTPKYKPRDSSLSVTGARDRSTSGKSQVSEPQRSIFKLPNQSSTVEGSRRGRTSNSTREQVNSNRSRFTNNANFHVPTIDRQKQHPPPEPTELNRILAQVPDILKELDEKQAQVIRDLAKKVNHQEDDIRDLKSNIVELNDHVTTSNNLIVELKNKVEQVERRVGQENQALREDNELLRKRVEKHIDVTCENIVEQVEHRLKQLEEKMTMEDDYEPSEGLIDVQDPAKAKEEDTNIFLQQE